MADKTQLNTGYAHYSDLVFATGFSEASGDFKELVSGSLLGVPTGGITRGTDGTYGTYASAPQDTADEINWGDNAAWDGLAACTVIALVRNNKTAQSDAEGIVNKEGSGNDAFHVAWDASEQIEGYVGIGATNNLAELDGIDDGTNPLGYVATDWNVVGFTWDGSNVVARINTDKSSPVAASGTMNATAHPLRTHARGAAGADTWDGDIAMVAIFDVALNDTDWNSLVSDPLQIFASDSGGLDVNATTAALTLTTQPATVSRGREVAATTAALTLTTHPATVSRGREVAATTAALTLTTHPATVSRGREVAATTAALTLTTHPATIVRGGRVVPATTAALTLTTQPATIVRGRTVEAAVAVLTLETFAATVVLGEAVAPPRVAGGFRMVRVPLLEQRKIEAVRTVAIEQLERLASDAPTEKRKQIRRIKRAVELNTADDGLDAFVAVVASMVTEAIAIVTRNIAARRGRATKTR